MNLNTSNKQNLISSNIFKHFIKTRYDLFFKFYLNKWIIIALTRASQNIKIYCNFFTNIYLAGKQRIVKDFIGFNNWPESLFVIKIALKLLDKNYNQFYEADEMNKKNKNTDQNCFMESLEIFIPFYVQTSKIKDKYNKIHMKIHAKNIF